MKMQKKSLIALAAGSLLLGTTAVMAFGGGHGFGHEGCGHGNPMRTLEQLDNVSDEQRSQLRTLFKEQRNAHQGEREAMRAARQAVQEAIDNGASSEQIRALADNQGKLVAARIVARAEMQQKVAAILTPEQLKELQELRADRMERHMGW